MIMLRLWAWITRGTPVAIRDFQGEVKYSIAYAYHDSFGHYWCRVHWLTAVGHCVLMEDGKVDPRSVSSYVREWRKV